MRECQECPGIRLLSLTSILPLRTCVYIPATLRATQPHSDPAILWKSPALTSLFHKKPKRREANEKAIFTWPEKAWPVLVIPIVFSNVFSLYNIATFTSNQSVLHAVLRDQCFWPPRKDDCSGGGEVWPPAFSCWLTCTFWLYTFQKMPEAPDFQVNHPLPISHWLHAHFWFEQGVVLCTWGRLGWLSGFPLWDKEGLL